MKRDLITAFKYVRGSYKDVGDKLWFAGAGNRTRNNDLQLQQEKFRFNIGKNFLTMRIDKH